MRRWTSLLTWRRTLKRRWRPEPDDPKKAARSRLFVKDQDAQAPCGPTELLVVLVALPAGFGMLLGRAAACSARAAGRTAAAALLAATVVALLALATGLGILLRCATALAGIAALLAALLLIILVALTAGLGMLLGRTAACSALVATTAALIALIALVALITALVAGSHFDYLINNEERTGTAWLPYLD